jgi:hypothetical protein
VCAWSCVVRVRVLLLVGSWIGVGHAAWQGEAAALCAET